MTLSANQTRFLHWCSDTYDDSWAIRRLKDRLYEMTLHYCERRLVIEW